MPPLQAPGLRQAAAAGGDAVLRRIGGALEPLDGGVGGHEGVAGRGADGAVVAPPGRGGGVAVAAGREEAAPARTCSNKYLIHELLGPQYATIKRFKTTCA